MNSYNNQKTILTPLEIAALFGFPTDLQEKLSKRGDDAPPSNDLVDRVSSASIDKTLTDLERERTSILESINLFERRIERAEDKKREHIKELENLSNLAPSLQSLKEKQVRKLIETDKEIYNNLGIEPRKSDIEEDELAPPYPTLGVATVGILMILIGSIILIPLVLPTTIKLVLGIGFLLIGFANLVNSLLHTRKKSTQTRHNDVNLR